MREWLGTQQGELAADNPVAALERGEIEVPHFEEQLAARLTEVTGHPVEAVGLLQRMFDQFEHAPAMSALVLRATRAGLRTGLLSNSWGNEYPREGWDQMFDAVVISGEVGMRKPEPQIYRHVLGPARRARGGDGVRRRPAAEHRSRSGARAGRRAPHVVRRDGAGARTAVWSPPPRLRVTRLVRPRGSAGPLLPGSRLRRRRCPRSRAERRAACRR